MRETLFSREVSDLRWQVIQQLDDKIPGVIKKAWLHVGPEDKDYICYEWRIAGEDERVAEVHIFKEGIDISYYKIAEEDDENDVLLEPVEEEFPEWFVSVLRENFSNV